MGEGRKEVVARLRDEVEVLGEVRHQDERDRLGGEAHETTQRR